jgi:cytochrome c2
MRKPLLLFFALLPSLAAVNGCGKHQDYNASVQSRIVQYGCPTCHVIPDVPGAVGKVGPSLESLGQRSYLAGRLTNNPANLELWVMHPQKFEPGVAMPEMGVTADDARRIAFFLENSSSSQTRDH